MSEGELPVLPNTRAGLVSDLRSVGLTLFQIQSQAPNVALQQMISTYVLQRRQQDRPGTAGSVSDVRSMRL
jgi:hypothetical protein